MSGFRLKCSCRPLGQLLLFLALSGLIQAEEKEKANAPKLAPLAPFEKYKPEDRGRWAYQPPKRPEVPKVENAAWVKTPVDAFVLARLERNGVMPAKAADRSILLRRVTIDLTGLPPSPEEIDAFVNDPDPNAYSNVVERLLASPHYGERWGQHWLDVVRYADTDGFEYDALRPDAWRYRDYVVKSFNNDKPFDRFILEQLAGDELAPGDQESLAAVGFNRLAAWRKNAGNQDEDMNRNEVLTEQANAVGAVFMGTTMACARCHDHLFDPIKQSDYYRLQAFFAPAVFKETSLASPEAQKAWDAKAKSVKAEMEKVKKAMAEMEQDWKKRLLEAKRSQLSEAERQALAVPADQRNAEQKALAAQANFLLASKVDDTGRKFLKELKDRKKAMMAALDDIESRMPEPLPAVWGIADERKNIPQIHILDRGMHASKGNRVGPRVPGLFLPDDSPEYEDDNHSNSTGRRLALARWLASSENPLTARVLVNRLWHYHFGRGIVATPNDFGAQGAPPTHPELLDWLATEFVQQKWSVKAMHRLMVLSSSYQTASEGEPEKLSAAGQSKDPGNNLFWRYNRRRIEAEAVRDAMLNVAGNFNPKAGGPAVLVPVQPVLIEQLYKPKQWAVTADPSEHHRRTIYLIAKRNLRLPFMEAFDAPDLQNSCSRREQSTHALQSLELLNGNFSNDQARVFAGRLLKENGWNPNTLVQRAFRLATGRKPTAQETQIAARFLSEQSTLLRQRLERKEDVPVPAWMPETLDKASGAALCDFSLAMFSLPGFLYLNLRFSRSSYLRLSVQSASKPIPEFNMFSNQNHPHVRFARNRREFIAESAAGFGGLALSFLLQQDLLRADAPRIVSPLDPKKPPLPAKAKSVIFLFQAGGPSQMDTFDPKPLLNKLEGQPLPKTFGPIRSQFLKENARILGTRRTFKKYGQSGIEVSDLFPHMSQCVDDMAIIRSCYCDIIVHSAAQYQMMSGRLVPGFPSMGSWVIYGLGSESHSLPAYVVMPAPEGALEGGQPMYGQGFLPAAFQPTMMRPGANPILNLDLPKGVSREQRRRTIDLIRDLGQASMAPDDNQVSARLASYELAFQMQTDAPEVVDIAHETQETKDLYGIGTQPSDDYGRRCLLARRMVEKGVRFVCVVAGGGPGELQWDAHSDIEENHHRLAAQTDKPVAGLLKDLKRRGLLDSTLVVWGGEFGRTALAEGRDPNALGRDHSPTGFTWWMAGGGIKGGTVVGATDDLGIHAVTDRIHFRDLHTTILNQLGLDQNQLTYLHLGREERLTELHGTVIEKIVT